MTVMELDDNKYTKVHKALSCLSEQIEYLKELMDDSVDFREPKRYREDYPRYRYY